MTIKELLKLLVSSADLTAAVNDIIAYVVQNRREIDSAASTLNGKVTTLIGSDTAKSVRTIANEELAAQLIPANAKEALDTLQEIAAWIQDHPDDASAMNTAITNLTTLVGTLPNDTEETTIVGWVTAELAALASTISGKNVGASGDTGNDALVEASASNNNVTVNSTQKLKDAVALAESSVQNVKTINGGAMAGTGDVTLPAELEANPESLTSAQVEALRIGDIVIKTDGGAKYSYRVTHKSATGMCLTYHDAENVETIAYDKENNEWSKTDKTITAISTALHDSDFATIGATAAKAIVAAAITAAETPAQSGE